MLDYGIRYLHTPVLLITATNDNQAIKFFLEDHNDLPLEISRDIDHLRLALTSRQQKKTVSKQPVELIDFVEANIDYQVEQAINRYRDRLKNGRLVIVGAVFDLDDKYGRGKNRLIVININGEKDGTKLRKARMCRKLDGRLLNFVGRKRKEN
jgi:carbonic anhydrase